MRKGTLFAALLFLTFNLYPQEIQSVSGIELKNPTATSSGIVFTDSKNSAIYLLQDNKPTLLISSPGCGNYLTYSKNKQLIGFKYIDNNGNQIPSIINLTTKEISHLYSPVKAAGQVSFADDGTYAFTIGNKLIVHSVKGAETEIDLGNYSNLTPISPNGNFAVYNNDGDKLFIINLLTNERRLITDNSCGYFSPIWSPDGNKILSSSLSGTLKVYDLESDRTYSLGEGLSPAWSNDSHLIIFYKNEIKNMQLLNSDLYISDITGSEIHQLTSSQNQFEVDPSFGNNDSEIVYSLSGSEKILTANFSKVNLLFRKVNEISVSIKPVTIQKFNSIQTTEDFDTLNIPYINQLYDTPDYYNGSAACGPTSAMMVLAFYKILPEWNIICSSPSRHISCYGRYICDAYRFKQINYTNTCNDPNGRPAKGAYGFMWASGSPYSTMVNFFYNHGIASTREDAPSYQTAIDVINFGKPFVICNALTTAGHITVAHGVATQSHTLIFNDPYGNKNISYPNPFGKNVKYDWPGYNNGFQNLNIVYWSVAINNYTPPIQSDTVIDDLDFYNGFYMNNNAPASMYSWKDLNQGYNGHMWFVFTNESVSSDTCYATWTPNLSRAGYYEIFAYIPYSQAQTAKYKIYTAQGLDSVIIDQEKYKDAWVSLGKFKFDKGNTGYVRLGDATGIEGQAIVFDAMKFTFVDSIETSVSQNENNFPKEFNLGQNYPNPFNPATTINYQVPYDSHVSIIVYDALGNEIIKLIDENKKSGQYSINFDANSIRNGLSSGVYFYRMTAGNFVETKKLILIK
ncbi:MAG: T9SS type A sorting domain-containing protein [Bacteroidetes bacterium]|nr:T9SS type A sorting domain-containing protein [Bacteroidota bacterium]